MGHLLAFNDLLETCLGNIYFEANLCACVLYTLLYGVSVQVYDVDITLVRAAGIPATHDHNIFCAIRLGDQTAGVVFLAPMQIWSTLP